MFERKIETIIKEYLNNENRDILIIDGARQVGKTSTIEYLGNQLFKNFVSINFVKDKQDKKIFENVNSTDEFYFALSSCKETIGKLNNNEKVLIFLDEIQEYPQFLTLLKFFKKDNKYKFICSGSLLGVTLKNVLSVPSGSATIKHMYPMDFEEFLWANGVSKPSIQQVKNNFEQQKSLPDSIHKIYLDYFKKYLLIGGLPEAVKIYINTKNIKLIRDKHDEISSFYGDDASKYDLEHKLKIKRIYDLIPSTLENTKKRLVIKDIENDKKACFDDYLDEFDYLVSSGIVTEVRAISNPVFPLIKSTTKNLVKFYLNDVGLMSNLYFKYSIKPILDEDENVNIGIIYECAVSNELKAHGYRLNYFDNKSKGEVDFIFDDYTDLSVIPIEIKSGKSYKRHKALNNLMSCKDYDVKKAYVFSNEREVKVINGITYMPIYYIMFFELSLSKQIIK